MYRAYGLLKPDNDFSVEEAIARLTPRFPGFIFTRNGDQVTISKADWEIELALVSGPHVITESQGITDRIAGMEQAETESLISNDKRVEVWSETPDPYMEHFNEFLLVVEVLKSFHGLVAVDPNERSLL